MSNENHSAHSEGHHGHFVVPAAAYVAVFIALLVLTVVTVAVAQVDFGYVGKVYDPDSHTLRKA